MLHVKFESNYYLVHVLSPGVPGVGAAVQGVQVAAEQSLTAAFTKVQVCFCYNTAKFSVISRLVLFKCGHFFSPASLQELTGQQQNPPEESEFDFPPDDGVASSSSEFGDEAAADFPADPAGTGQNAAGVYQSAAGGKQTLFEGYNDPGKQFGGHTRSYHRDARYSCTIAAFDEGGGKVDT